MHAGGAHLQTQTHSDRLSQDLGVFIPPQNDAMRNDFFMDNTSFIQSKMKFDRETFGGLADMFGQMPGTFFPLDTSSYLFKVPTN